MKLALGLYCHQLDRDHFRFARQCGCTDVVIHLVDYFRDAGPDAGNDQPLGDVSGWGRAGDPDQLWTAGRLRGVCELAKEEGLEIAALENIDPAHWSDVLLDGPLRDDHIGNVRRLIRTLGAVGIPVLGYNFSIAGVCARITTRNARGKAVALGVDGGDDRAVPEGMVWNMRLRDRLGPGALPEITEEELWHRYRRFLEDVLPVAEEAGVTLAAHPDDPPFERLRRTPRLIRRHGDFERAMGLHASPNHKLEFCIGTAAEMEDIDMEALVDRHSKAGHIAYIHLRNVRGRVPRYHETFIDEGDVNMLRILSILKKNGYNGAIIPDHSPQMSCPGPWYAGMAHSLGWIRATWDAI